MLEFRRLITFETPTIPSTLCTREAGKRLAKRRPQEPDELAKPVLPQCQPQLKEEEAGGGGRGQ